MAHQYSRVGFNSSVEVNEVNLSLSYGGVAFLQFHLTFNHIYCVYQKTGPTWILLLIPNATNDWRKSWDFFTHITQGKSAKLFTTKVLSCNTPMKLDVILCDQHAFVINARADFIQHMPDKSFLVNNFADFLNVRVKKSRFCPVVGGVSLQQHLLLCFKREFCI